MKKRIVVSVSNDLSTDQRVRKQCHSLHTAGYEVVLLGRQLPESLPVIRPYRLVRMRLWFRKKAAFYAELNIRLFWRLLFSRADLYYANDLDTLPANALAALIRRKPLVYDSHEFFTEVPEIQGRLWVKKSWAFLERTFIGRAQMVLTVNPSIAHLLEQTYGLKEVRVVRNVPDTAATPALRGRAELDLPEGGHLLILQGSGINVDRGAEELFEAVALTSGVHLVVVGSGDALPGLKQRATAADLQGKISFRPRMPYRDMMAYTAAADLGLSLDKDTNLNYRYSLPNKVFDYVSAGIPMLVSDLVEVRRFVDAHDLGVVASHHEPQYLADLVHATLSDEAALVRYRENARKTAPAILWSKEYAPIVEEIARLMGALPSHPVAGPARDDAKKR